MNLAQKAQTGLPSEQVLVHTLLIIVPGAIVSALTLALPYVTGGTLSLHDSGVLFVLLLATTLLSAGLKYALTVTADPVMVAVEKQATVEVAVVQAKTLTDADKGQVMFPTFPKN